MTKKHFIRLAETIKAYNQSSFHGGTNTVSPLQFTYTQIQCLADFCGEQNPRFDCERWLDFIAGKCGPNGGIVK